MINEHDLEASILDFGTSIIQEMEKYQSTFSFRAAENALMNWALENETLKINLFRLVDTLPSLHTSSDIARHIKEYFADQKTVNPQIRLAAKLSSSPLMAPFVALVAKKQIRLQSKRFIAGTSPKNALPALKKLRAAGHAFTIDLLGETALSEVESKEYIDRYSDLITVLTENDHKISKSYPVLPDHPADKNIIHISIKLSSLYSQTKAIDFENSVNTLTERISNLFSQVKAAGGIAYIDMEDCSMTDITLAVLQKTLSQDEFKSYPGFGFVLQAYLKRTKKDVADCISWARKRGTPVCIRLVKGAYWDSETIMSRQRDWPCPVFEKKEHSDASYEEISRMLLDAGDIIYPAFASHNIRSMSHAIVYAETIGRKKSQFETQFLYGMGDEFKKALSHKGFLTRDYTPIGELLPGMAYLVRRLLENTANEGFLRQVEFDNIDPYILLRTPRYS